MANEAERQRWNTPSIAMTWPRRERLTTVITQPLLDLLELRPGERVLDVGSGGGLLSIAAAKAVTPGGAVVGFDISEPLAALARQRAESGGVAGVSFTTGDAQTDSVDGGPFDVVTSQFGVMFFADPVAAFANLRSHMSPNGRLGFMSWQPADRNTWFPGPVLARYAPPPPPRAADAAPTGPFAFGDPAHVRSILKAAGFAKMTHVELTFDVEVRPDTIFDRESVAALRLDKEREAQAWGDLEAFADAMRTTYGQLKFQLAPQFFGARVSK